jgi:hypothetical protein
MEHIPGTKPLSDGTYHAAICRPLQQSNPDRCSICKAADMNRRAQIAWKQADRIEEVFGSGTRDERKLRREATKLQAAATELRYS